MDATTKTTASSETKLTPAQLRILREVAKGDRPLRKAQGRTFASLIEAGLLRRAYIGDPPTLTEAGFDALSKAGTR